MLEERLKTFLAVAANGSFSGAARERFVTQPAVTQQIRKLEGLYRVTLFVRHERGVSLTPAGEMLHDYAVRMAELETEAEEALAALHESLGGSLRVGATLTLGEYLVPPIIGRFKAAHPEVEILLEVENTPKVVEHVANGRYSCGLIEGPYHNVLVRSEKLADDELAVVCGADHPLAAVGSLTLDDVARAPWVLREPESGTRRVFEDALASAGLEPSALKVVMQLGSTQAVKGLVIGGAGLTVVSPWSVSQELTQGQLRRLAVPELDLHRAFSFVFVRGGRLPLVTRRFVRFCREQVAEMGSDHAVAPCHTPLQPGVANHRDEQQRHDHADQGATEVG